MDRLDDTAIERELTTLDAWRREDDGLVRELRFDGFREAIAFIGRVGDLAEAADHHPELHNVHSRVTVRLTTHDVGGITTADVELARAIDGAVAG